MLHASVKLTFAKLLLTFTNKELAKEGLDKRALLIDFSIGHFYTRGRIIRPEGLCILFFFVIKMHYPPGRTLANFCSSSGYASLV